MKTRSPGRRRVRPTRMLPLLLAGALGTVAGLAPLAAVDAQQSGQAQMGGGQGSGSGGTVSGVAGPQGSGSGGTTAGASAGAGSPSGTGTGPGPVNQNRFGGSPAETPEEPTDGDDGAPSVLSSMQSDLDGDAGRGGEGYVLGRGGRCEDYELGRMTVEERIRGANRDRLAAAEAYLAPGFADGEPRTPAYILANYQQELEQTEASLVLAGTYLGLVATRRVTPEVVVQVNNLLCLATVPKQAESIAMAAETQRLMVR